MHAWNSNFPARYLTAQREAIFLSFPSLISKWKPLESRLFLINAVISVATNHFEPHWLAQLNAVA